LIFEATTDSCTDGIKPLRDKAREIRLPCPQHIAHAAQPTDQFGIGSCEVRNFVIELTLMRSSDDGFGPPRPNSECDQEKQR
jgi:hypothetical protein